MPKTTDVMSKYLESLFTPEQMALIGLAADLEQLSETVAELDLEPVTNVLDRLDREIAGVKGTLDQVANKVTMLRQGENAVNESLKVLDARLADHTETDQIMSATLARLNKRITTLEELLDAATKPKPEPPKPRQKRAKLAQPRAHNFEQSLTVLGRYYITKQKPTGRCIVCGDPTARRNASHCGKRDCKLVVKTAHNLRYNDGWTPEKTFAELKRLGKPMTVVAGEGVRK